MSVLIKGMTMPETCYECRFCESEAEYPFRLFCVSHLNRIEDPRSGRLGTCPLEEPPTIGHKMSGDDWEEPEINPCRGCGDYDGRGGCKSSGGCGADRSEDVELKPCPICGGKAILVSHLCTRGISPYNWWVTCCNGCICTKAYTSDHDAEEMWNSIGEIKE